MPFSGEMAIVQIGDIMLTKITCVHILGTVMYVCVLNPMYDIYIFVTY